MMTDEARATAPPTVPWRELARISKHRTSAPTDAAVRSAAATITAARDGRAASVDSVFLAALRIAQRDPERLRREVERIEGERFKVE